MAPASLVRAGHSAAAWSLTVGAQQRPTKLPRIGIIDNTPIFDHFRQALHDLGYIDGKTIAFEYRVAEGKPDRLTAAAAELVRLPVDVIAVYGTAPARAASSATASIPIVVIGIGDAVRAGIAASLARPGGNVTGNSILAPDIVGKRLQFIKEVFPAAGRVVFLLNPDNASHIAVRDELQAAAPALGVQMIFVRVGSSNDFESTFETMLKDRPDAFTMSGDPFHLLHIGWIIGFLAKNRVPAVYQYREHVVAGGLMSYGASQPELFRRAAGYVHKILQGTKPSDLPFEQPIKFEL